MINKKKPAKINKMTAKVKHEDIGLRLKKIRKHLNIDQNAMARTLALNL